MNLVNLFTVRKDQLRTVVASSPQKMSEYAGRWINDRVRQRMRRHAQRRTTSAGFAPFTLADE